MTLFTIFNLLFVPSTNALLNELATAFFTTLVSYLAARLLENETNVKKKKAVLACAAAA